MNLGQNRLYIPQTLVSPCRRMRSGPILSLLLPTLLTLGCSSTLTNLTPSTVPRNANGVYPVEVDWQHRLQALRPETVKAYVVVGLEQIPMQAVPIVSNRWESLLPIPADKSFVYYRFKFDYELNGMPLPRHDSKLSKEYKVQIAAPNSAAPGKSGLSPADEKRVRDALHGIK